MSSTNTASSSMTAIRLLWAWHCDGTPGALLCNEGWPTIFDAGTARNNSVRSTTCNASAAFSVCWRRPFRADASTRMSAVVFARTLSAPWSLPVNARAEEPPHEHALSLEGQQVVAARRREPAAFEALVRRHQTTLYNFCLRMLGQPDDAADVAQETFVQLYSHLGRLDEQEPLAPWLFRVARNRCIDLIRRRRTVPLQLPDESGEGGLTLEPADDDPLPDEMVAWPWIVVGLVAVGLLTIAGYELGASLAANDGLDVVAGVFADLGLLATSPGDVVAALAEVVPWSLVVMAGVSAAVLILAA